MTSMLTTVDNPFDPFTQFDEWFNWDATAGYYTCGLLARYVDTSADMTDEERITAINNAMDTVIELNPMGVHRKVTKEKL